MKNKNKSIDSIFPAVLAITVGSLLIVILLCMCCSLVYAHCYFINHFCDLNSDYNISELQEYTHVRIKPDLISLPYNLSNDTAKSSFVLAILDEKDIRQLIFVNNVDTNSCNIMEYSGSLNNWIVEKNRYYADVVIEGYLVKNHNKEKATSLLVNIGITEDTINRKLFPYTIVTSDTILDVKPIIMICVGGVVFYAVLMFLSIRNIRNNSKKKGENNCNV